MKPGPVIAMVALIAVGVWLVLQPSLGRPKSQMVTRFGAVELRYEQRVLGGDGPDAGQPGMPSPGGDVGRFEYRVINRAGLRDRWISAGEFQSLLHREWEGWASRPAFERTLLGFFNITSWGNLLWVLVGLGGQAAFFGRMLVQWVVSEKQRQSVVPTLFWWLSLGGGICLFTYFVWRVDFVGVLGQSTGIVIYARNLRLISKQRRREARRASRTAGAEPGATGEVSRATADTPDLNADPAPEPTGA